MAVLLENRNQAGHLLALKLTAYHDRLGALVLALPRGGVPVAYEIAKYLHLPLDICLVRKLGVPAQKELAMGAIASEGVVIFNEDIINWLKIPKSAVDRVIAEELAELARREQAYRGDRPLPAIKDRTIILVDDGIATGASLRAAIQLIKQRQPKEIIIAVPVVSSEIYRELETEVAKIVCLIQENPLNSISVWYRDFQQVTDREVREYLESSF